MNRRELLEALVLLEDLRDLLGDLPEGVELVAVPVGFRRLGVVAAVVVAEPRRDVVPNLFDVRLVPAVEGDHQCRIDEVEVGIELVEEFFTDADAAGPALVELLEPAAVEGDAVEALVVRAEGVPAGLRAEPQRVHGIAGPVGDHRIRSVEAVDHHVLGNAVERDLADGRHRHRVRRPGRGSRVGTRFRRGARRRRLTGGSRGLGGRGCSPRVGPRARAGPVAGVASRIGAAATTSEQPAAEHDRPGPQPVSS